VLAVLTDSVADAAQQFRGVTDILAQGFVSRSGPGATAGGR